MTLTQEKLAQAIDILQRSDVDTWMVFVRETSAGGDPVLPLILNGGLTWTSALIVTRDGGKFAVVGNYDADPLIASGDWDEVVPYVQGIGPELLRVLGAVPGPRIAINYSENDVMADGLSHGLYLMLRRLLQGTSHELVSAEAIVGELRGVKTESEVRLIREAIRETERIFREIPEVAQRGMSERALYDHIQGRMAERGLGYSWDKAGDPIVNFGPHSMIGHGIPRSDLYLEDGQILHIDLGVIREGYASDIQRCWFVGETVPEDVLRGLEAVNAAITAGSELLRPGVRGVDVDAAARATIQRHGYPEYLHALGHQVGRVAHDGGGLLGPAWDRYGDDPFKPVLEGQIYTLELGVVLEGRGYLGIEEMVRVTADGIEWLTDRQLTMPTI